MNKSKNNNGLYVKLMLIIILVAFLVMGKYNPSENAPPEGVQPISQLTRLQKGNGLDYFTSLSKDLLVFTRNFKKTNSLELDKQIDDIMIPKINNLSKEINSLKEQEKLLQSQLNGIPNESYTHSKIELSSFIVEGLKKQSLVYEINYNYVSASDATTAPQETTAETEVATVSYTNAFMIKVFKINEGDNYTKLLTALDAIFIKEPYEILSMTMEFDEISMSYYLMLVIEV